MNEATESIETTEGRDAAADADATEQNRSIETSVRIAAPPAAVWRALTDARELTRWFPLDARVKPGAGGSIWMAWDDQYQGETPIGVWEPERRLRMVVPGTPVAIDFTLEREGEGTVLRLVHSGFGSGHGWDEELEETTRGWRFQLEGLRFYLERHLGVDRTVVWSRVLTDLPTAERWRHVVEGGVLLDDTPFASVREGAPLRGTLPGGARLEGRVVVHDPPKEITVAVDAPMPGLLRVHCDDLPFRGVTDVNVWLSTYGLSRPDAARLRQAWNERLLERVPGARLPSAQGPQPDPSFGQGGASA